MARKARVEFVEAVYHVLDRGERREAIFSHVPKVGLWTRQHGAGNFVVGRAGCGL